MAGLGCKPVSKWVRFAAALCVALQFMEGTAHAFDFGMATGDKMQGPGLTSEFIYRNDTEEALIPVYLLGAVAKPGLYHIPGNMDVVGLLTLAGGTHLDAQIDDILVRSQGKTSHKRNVRFDLNKIVKGGDTDLMVLNSNDLVYVPPGKPPVPFTTTLLTTIGIVGGTLGIIATIVILGEALKPK